ncbi:MAG TPA: 7TM diverse intracellular signaling domain-containing protein [Oligoflexus sp.]|uniref:sensor histidine kinase n=1 Tax=Oligoflexus sp. TaxID=1971216 RepID=UPI002D80A93F|nr:7TM diverse intracellular signaling domain-containing protein [Oligoflexus sp.]HET9237073.1 7TM diverse intracellular signaling domain-containing protein [Oligoflexus sp.]
MGQASHLKSLLRVCRILSVMLFSMGACARISFAQMAPLVLQNQSQDVSDALVVLRSSDQNPEWAIQSPETLLKTVQTRGTPNRKSWGYSSDTLWLAGSFQNTSDHAQERVLALPFSSPTVADFYVFSGQDELLKTVRTGTLSPLETRELKLNLTGILLEIPAHDTVHVLIRQQSHSLLDTHYTLRLTRDHQKLEWIYLAAYGLYFGLALALFFHNLSLYFAVRDRVYLTYLAYVLCISAAMLFSSAYYSLFWYRTPAWLHFAPYATPALACVGAAFFFCEFLHLHPKTSWLARFMMLIAGLSILSAGGSMVWPQIFMPWNPFLNTGVLVVGLCGCILKVVEKERYAWFLLIAILSPILTVGAYYIGNFAFKASVPSDIMSAAFGLEMILMSAGLSQRIHEIRQRQYLWESQQEAIIYQSKMKALSEMASGMAHEINNPLMIISGYADVIDRLLKRHPLDIQHIRNLTGKITATVERIAYIVQSLRSFARMDADLAFEKVSLQEILQQALALFESRIQDADIKLTIEVPEEPCMVYGLSSQLIQVVSTLLDNAISALRGASHKSLDVRLVFKKVDSHLRAVLTIQDSGHGIPRDLQTKIFQPFFTTRPMGEGVGLSLSRAQGIVKSFNGQLYLDSEAPATSFVMELPLIDVA